MPVKPLGRRTTNIILGILAHIDLTPGQTTQAEQYLSTLGVELSLLANGAATSNVRPEPPRSHLTLIKGVHSTQKVTQ